MVTYGSSEKYSDIYTSTDGTSWSDEGPGLCGSGLPDYNKIDGPYPLHQRRRLGARLYYFQVKVYRRSHPESLRHLHRRIGCHIVS